MSTVPTDRTRERIRIEPEPRAVNVSHVDTVLASTREALVLYEDGHAPVHYIPRKHVEMAHLVESPTRTTCPYKGEARYWLVTGSGEAADDAAWAYDNPHEGVAAIAGYLAFDPKKVTINVE